MAIMSNILLGLWIFWSRFLKHVQKQKKSSLFYVVVPPLNKQTYSLNSLLYDAYMKSISKSWVFFMGALLLTRNAPWKRYQEFVHFVTFCSYFGLGLTTSYSIYLAIFTHF